MLKFGFKGAATRGVRKEAIPFFTVNGGGYWAADGVATPVKADAKALRGGASPAVTLTAGGTIAFDGADTGTAAPAGGAVALRCVFDTGKYVCFVFADGEVIRIGSELNGSTRRCRREANPSRYFLSATVLRSMPRSICRAC